MKLWDLQHHFQSWFFWILERTAKLHVQNPYCLRTIVIMNSKHSPKKKKKKCVFFLESGKKKKTLTGLWLLYVGLFDTSHKFFPLLFCHSSGFPTVPQSKAKIPCVRMLRGFPQLDSGGRGAPRFALEQERKGGVDAAGPQRITAPIAAPCHSQIWQSYSGSFPSRTFKTSQPDNHSSVRKEDAKLRFEHTICL